jgi:hypothetical protein
MSHETVLSGHEDAGFATDSEWVACALEGRTGVPVMSAQSDATAVS